MTSPSPVRACRGEDRESWAADTVVFAASAARFGDRTWKFGEIAHSANVTDTAMWVRFSAFPPAWERLAREHLMALVDVAALRDVGVIRQRSAHARTLVGESCRLLALARWATEHDLGLPSTWSPEVPSRYLHQLPTSSRRTVEQAAETLKRLWRHRSLYRDGGLTVEPWPGSPAVAVPALVLKAAAPPVLDRCATPVMAPGPFFALLTAALAYVHDFAGDIIAATEATSAADAVTDGLGGPAAVGHLTAWAADPASRVPVDAQGRPVWAHLAALTGIKPRAFSAGKPTGQRLRPIAEQLAVEGRTVASALYQPAVNVTRPDGSIGGWRAPMRQSDSRTELRSLRTAAYIVLLALTGMRDSEGQDVRKNSLHERMGTLAVMTHRYKHANGEELFQWVSDDAAAAYDILACISKHPTHIVAALNSRRGELAPGMRGTFMAIFVDHVNAGRHLSGLDEITDTDVHPQRLRHTFAYVAGLFEGGDLAVGDRFGHAFATTTASYQMHRPDDEWFNWKHQGHNAAALRRWTMLADLLDKSGGSTVGRDAAEIEATARQVKALVVSNPKAAERLAGQAAQTWRPGPLLDCHYDPAKADVAVCRQLAASMGLPHLGEGPLPDLCPTRGCIHGTVTPVHAPSVRAKRDAAAERAAVATSPIAAAQAQTVAADLTVLLDQIQPGPTP